MLDTTVNIPNEKKNTKDTFNIQQRKSSIENAIKQRMSPNENTYANSIANREYAQLKTLGMCSTLGMYSVSNRDQLSVF